MIKSGISVSLYWKYWLVYENKQTSGTTCKLSLDNLKKQQGVCDALHFNNCDTWQFT